MPPEPSTSYAHPSPPIQPSAFSLQPVAEPSGIRIDHVAIGAPDAAHARDQFWALLGGRIVWDDPIGSGTGFRGVMMRSGESMLEVIEPMGEGSFVTRFLESRGPGIHHITYYLDDPDSIVARAQAEGRLITGIERSDGMITNAFFHPKSAHGIVIQLRPNRKYEPRTEASRHHHRAATSNLPPAAPEHWTVDRVVLIEPAIAPVQAFFQSYFGGTVEHDLPGTLAGGREVVLRWKGLGVGIVEPTDPAGPVGQFLADRGPGAHSLVLRRGPGAGDRGQGEAESDQRPAISNQQSGPHSLPPSPHPLEGIRTDEKELEPSTCNLQPSTALPPSALVIGTLLRFVDG